MLSFLLGLIPGALNTINGVTNALSNQKIAALKAKTDEDRIAAEERIKILEARRDALMNAQTRSKFPIFVQSCLGMIAVIILAKMGLWDKVVGSFLGCAGEAGKFPGCETFRTDPLGTDLTTLVGGSLAFYLLVSNRWFNK